MISGVAFVVDRLAVGLLERTVELSALGALLDHAVGAN